MEARDERGGGVSDAEWYPAGVSPSNYPCEEEIGVFPAEEMQLYEVDSKTVSTKDLHTAAFHIQRWFNNTL